MFGGWKTWFNRSRAGRWYYPQKFSAEVVTHLDDHRAWRQQPGHGSHLLLFSGQASWIPSTSGGWVNVMEISTPSLIQFKGAIKKMFYVKFYVETYFGIYWSQLTNAHIFQGVGPPSTIFGSCAWIRPCLTVFGIIPSDHTLDVWDSVEGPKQPSDFRRNGWQ